ncbi:ankyrin repeat-containing domain protein [Mycena rebaudengoi]|nr:ankyrin repeat-containing domain protein [Mycena rebaudengoi]
MAEIFGLVVGILDLLTTLKAGIEIGVDTINAAKEQRDMLGELRHLEPLLKDLQDRLKRNQSVNGIQQLKDPLSEFKLVMGHICDNLQSANKARSSKAWKAVTWALRNKKGTQEDIRKMERFKALLNSWLTMDIWDSSQEQRQDNETAKRDKIIEWMSPLNPFRRHKDIFGTHQGGTGQWLLADIGFTTWKESVGGTLWCQGIPGAGKTVLSSVVVNYLQAQFQPIENIGVACLYLNHKEGDLQSPENLLASLWWQLVIGKPLVASVHKLYEHHHDRRTRPSVQEIDNVFRSVIAEYSKVYLVIDALDEYPDDQRHWLLNHLATLGPKTNVMLTSRPHITLNPTLFPEIHTLEICATEDDICRYVDSHIQMSPRLSRHVQSRPELHQEIEAKILHNVEGMFLLAKLHVDFLATKITVKSLREALKNLPKDLEHTYNEAIERIEAQSEEDRNLAFLALTWVANAKRPLTIAELQEAIAIEVDSKLLDPDSILDITYIVGVCGGLMVIDLADGRVRLIHYTTQGYLDSVQATKFPWAQTKITEACLTYLSFETFQNLPRSWKVKDDVEALLHRHAFLDYAFEYCLIHAAGLPELQFKNLILSFLAGASQWHDFWEVACFCRQSDWNIPWNYGNWPKNPTKLWFAVLFNLQHIFKELLVQEGPIDDKPLIAASYYGYMDIVHLLIEKGANVNAQGGEYGNALQAASSSGHESIVHLLIEKGENVNAQGGSFGNALQAASSSGHESIVHLLIEKGANVNAQGGRFGNALQAASYGGHESIVHLLIEKGENVNAQGGSFGNALQAASYGGHESIVHLLIEKGENVNAQGGSFGNALQAASCSGHESIVHLLIEKGADVNAQGGEDGNALQAASSSGHESIVHLLIEKGANVNAQGGHFGNALQAAASYGRHESIVHLLIEKGANVNAQGGSFGNALQAASYGGHESIVHLLIEKGENVNAQGGSFGNALQAASCSGHESIVHLLIEKGADVNAQGGEDGNALQAASSSGHESIVHLLIEKGANVNAQGGHFGNALQAAASYGRHESIVHLLIEKGANVNAQGGEYGNALQAASSWGHESIVHLLIEKGANVNAQGGHFGNALQAAASYGGHESIVHLLIEKGADVNAQGGESGNALQAASFWGYESIVHLLIEKGADVNAQGGNFGTALQAASSWGHESIVHLLIEKGANVNAQGGRFGNALQTASEKGHESIVRLLIKNGADVNAEGGGFYGNALQAALDNGHQSVTARAGEEARVDRGTLGARTAGMPQVLAGEALCEVASLGRVDDAPTLNLRLEHALFLRAESAWIADTCAKRPSGSGNAGTLQPRCYNSARERNVQYCAVTPNPRRASLHARAAHSRGLEASALRLAVLEHLNIASPSPRPTFSSPSTSPPPEHPRPRDTTAALPCLTHLTKLALLPAPHTPPPTNTPLSHLFFTPARFVLKSRHRHSTTPPVCPSRSTPRQQTQQSTPAPCRLVQRRKSKHTSSTESPGRYKSLKRPIPMQHTLGCRATITTSWSSFPLATIYYAVNIYQR